MKRVLIITPRFPPVNAPDHHRVRMSLPFYAKYGWEPTVLAVTPETSEGVFDPQLVAGLPPEVKVVRVPAWPEEKVRRFGFGQMDYRCLLPLYQAGTRLLKEQRYDVIYFSTSAFLTLVLAPFWKRRFGCRIVFDVQDPWYQGREVTYTAQNAPGGWFKYRLSHLISRYGEAFAFRATDHVISVSPGYVKALSSLYHRPQDEYTVIPFGAAQRDYDTVKQEGIRPQSFQPGDGLLHCVYVGRAGPDLDPVLSALFRSLAQLRDRSPDVARRIRLHFIGTNYSPSHRTFNVVKPVAEQFGVADLVDEHSERVPYFQAMAEMAESDAVLLIGSVAREYTASKLFNCIMSGKPVLALFHAESLVSQLIPRFPNARLAQFQDNPEEPAFQAAVTEGLQWLLTEKHFDQAAIDTAIEPFSAEKLTAEQCAVFDQVVSR